ncbi:hypothetical protein HQ544_00205 [Candidatus Falkowbacteria bacterium]|nr:hypothetical protein [Candidatus Falkowbacteria bacterium]
MSQNPSDNQNTQDSILDQVIDEQHEAKLHEFKPKETIGRLFDVLGDQEQEILRRRYALLEVEIAKRQTLEAIGKEYSLTRERIRQIENRAIKKIKERDDFKDVVTPFTGVVNQILEEYGGVMEENFLIDKLIEISPVNSKDTKKVNFEKQAILFMIDKLIDETEKVASSDYFTSGWRTKASDLENFKGILDSLHNFIESKGDPINKEKLVSEFKKSSPEVKDLAEKVIHSALEISSRTKSNPFNEWGLVEWKKITPKRMGDKILLVLEKHTKPLHFTEIADLINKHKFDKKVAHPATVHNELIMADDFVLVGRGIYALKKWGYKTGLVSDVITQTLREQGPLTRDEIIEELLSQRMVKEGTVILALSDKNRFKKLDDGRYTVVE